MASRNLTLDGLRGCLAVLVLVSHVFAQCGSQALRVPAMVAVWIFFLISAYVLTQGCWDGRFVLFLVRRVVRLWPTYALCLAGGFCLLGAAPDPLEFIWLPLRNWPPAGDPPGWSLTVEGAAMLGMPVIALVGRGGFARLVIAMAGSVIAMELLTPHAFYAPFFFIGAWLTRFEFHLKPLETSLPQWFGRISYPLYVCHYPIIVFAGLPLWMSIPLAFAVAELLTRTVEKWSIQASRRAGRFTLMGIRRDRALLQTS